MSENKKVEVEYIAKRAVAGGCESAQCQEVAPHRAAISRHDAKLIARVAATHDSLIAKEFTDFKDVDLIARDMCEYFLLTKYRKDKIAGLEAAAASIAHDAKNSIASNLPGATTIK